MRKNVFEASEAVSNFVNEWPAERRPKNGSCYVAYDPEWENILMIDAENTTPVPDDVAPGCLFRVDFDESGGNFETILIS